MVSVVRRAKDGGGVWWVQSPCQEGVQAAQGLSPRGRYRDYVTRGTAFETNLWIPCDLIKRRAPSLSQKKNQK